MKLPVPFLAAVILGALLCTAPSRAGEPLKIREGWVDLTSILDPIVFEKHDIMKHYGVSYTVEAMHFLSSSAQLTALATGDLDIQVGGPITVAHAVENAGMNDVRIIADGFQDGIADYFSSQYLVRADSGITTIEDLKGKVLVSNGIGGTMDVVIRAALASHHMTDKRDFTLIEAETASQNGMLLAGKVDLISSIPPFTYDPALAGKTRLLFTMKDIIGPSQMTILFARTAFLAANHAALVDYFEDVQRGVTWFLDPAHRDEMLEIVSRATKLPAARFAGYLYTKADYYHDPGLRPNVAAMQHDIANMRERGYVKSAFDITKYVDLSLAEEAAKRSQ